MEYEAVIGLEVHAQLKTNSKIFCGCSTAFGSPPNSNTCPVCLGMPGALPVLNRKVVEMAIKTALATNCKIAKSCRFARKNYFYPDLPKNYQISQYELPLAYDGFIEIETADGIKKIGLMRIHMEEDAGKLIHIEGDGHWSLVDFNRSAVPLLEIVSKPDIRSPEEGVLYLRRLRAILMYLDVCDGNMEEGSFRCDANISVRPKGSSVLGTKVEVKNMNSFRFIERALDYEIKRQIRLLEEGEQIVQETRLWDAEKGITVSMRGKEEAHDYRYFPEPDLVPLIIDEKWIEEIRGKLPELPQQRKERFIKELHLPPYDAEVIVSSKALADYFEQVVQSYPRAKIVSNWILTELLRELNRENIDADRSPFTPSHMVDLLRLIDEGIISGKMAKGVFEESYRSQKMPSQIVKEKGLVQITDEAEIERVARKVIEQHKSEVEEYLKGKERLIGFFVGELMKRTKGRANPKKANEILRRLLEEMRK